MTSTPRKRADASVPDISVIVPVLNEAGNIRPLIDEICDAFSGRDFEIIYVDDASTDVTIWPDYPHECIRVFGGAATGTSPPGDLTMARM